MTAPAQQTAVDLQRQREVVAVLRTFLPDTAVLFAQEDVKPYECDGLGSHP